MVPVVSFHRLEFCFFLQPGRSSLRWRALLLFGYAAATVRMVFELVTACHRLAVSVVSAYRRHSAWYTVADPLLFADVYGKI